MPWVLPHLRTVLEAAARELGLRRYRVAEKRNAKGHWVVAIIVAADETVPVRAGSAGQSETDDEPV